MFLAIVCGYVGLGFATSDYNAGCALVYAAGTYVSVIVSGETSIIVGSPSDYTYGTVIDAAVDYIARTEVLSCNSACITGTSGRIDAPIHSSSVDASLYVPALCATDSVTACNSAYVGRYVGFSILCSIYGSIIIAVFNYASKIETGYTT